MGLQSGGKTAAGERQSQYGSTAGLHDPFAEESTAVLLRRAEHLLDEMMLGAVDAGGEINGASSEAYRDAYGGAHHTNGIFAPLEAGADPGAPPATASNGPMPPQPPTAVEDHLRAAATERTPRLVAAEDRYADASAREERSRTEAAAFAAAGAANGAVRRQSASPASMMTVGARMASRSNLLPRSTEVDVAAAQQEIDVLLHEVATQLPPGHEATERSRHLLTKAQTILLSDQSRSAEIEYYLQQVRRILERTQQRQAWSALYRSRLMFYLVGWTLLAAVVLLGIGLYRTGFALLLAALFGAAPDAPWVLFAGMTLATACAGALGATLGVFAGIARRQRTEYGYFDRKYGLRGLLMPLLGFAFGASIALAAGALFFVLGVDPNRSLVTLLPLVLAFFVGVGQESLYGAR